MLEDVLVQIGDFFFEPVDFLVLDMGVVHKGMQPPILFGRPFSNTANACINCRSGAMEISFGVHCSLH